VWAFVVILVFSSSRPRTLSRGCKQLVLIGHAGTSMRNEVLAASAFGTGGDEAF